MNHQLVDHHFRRRISYVYSTPTPECIIVSLVLVYTCYCVLFISVPATYKHVISVLNLQVIERVSTTLNCINILCASCKMCSIFMAYGYVLRIKRWGLIGEGLIGEDLIGEGHCG